MRCPDCAAEMDPLREFCSKCGSPTDPGLRERLGERLRGGQSGRPAEELKRNRKTVLIIAAGVLIASGVIAKTHLFGSGLFLPTDVITIGAPAQSRGPVTIGAQQIYQAYAADPALAEKRFAGREMVVSGEFVRTVPDGYGSIDMRLKTSNPDAPLGVDLNGDSVGAATKLEPGQRVTVSCRRIAGSGNDHWLQDCLLQPPSERDSASPSPPAPPAPPGHDH